MKKQEPCSIILNGVNVCRVPPTKVPGQILSVMINIPYLSFENMKDKIRGILDLCFEAGIAGSCSRVFQSLQYAVESGDRDIVMTAIYNAILSSEGYGLLSGFGYAEKTGDEITARYFLNAEKISILKVGQ